MFSNFNKVLLFIILVLCVLLGFEKFKLKHCKSQFQKAEKNTLKLQTETKKEQEEIKQNFTRKTKAIVIKNKNAEDIDSKTLFKEVNKIFKNIENEVAN